MIGLPDAFINSARDVLQEDLNPFLESLREHAPLSIRFNPKKNSARSANKIVPWSGNGVYLPSRPSFTLDPLFHAGTYYVQEPSSMFVGNAFQQVAQGIEAPTVLDLCAAPGGKSTDLMSVMASDGLLVSNEVIRSRASALSENLKKWGHANCVVTNNDPRDFSGLSGFFDTIIIDAPCSGEGLFRKDPAAIAEWSLQHVQLCASRQKRIIADVWPALKENGTLIYCTCTYNRSENEENLQWLADHHDVEFLRLQLDPSWGIREVTTGKIMGYRFFPHLTKGEGFFLSAIKKKEGAAPATNTRMSLAPLAKKTADDLRGWINHASPQFILHKDTALLLPAQKAKEIDLLVRNLYVVHAGTAVATIKHQKLVPEHALALSIHLNQDAFPSTSVAVDNAIRYLRRESPALNLTKKGYHLVSFEGQPLGWINNLGTRYNNMYPMEWRIRMSSDAS